MALFKSVLVLMAAAVVLAEPQQPGKNQYLPPDPKGYNYPKPDIPFTSPRPGITPRPPPFSQPPPFNPPTPFRPPTPGPFPPPSQTPYRPPTPGPFPPPSQTPYRPPTPGPFPPPSQTPYRPPTPGPYPPPSQTPYRPPTITPTRPSVPIRPPTPHYDGSTLLPEPNHHHHDHVHEPGMPFDFTYAVKDPNYGTDYSHNAVSDGDVVQGEYRVQLPDGRMQIVRYTADWKSGFHADVSYEGQPRYPDTPSGSYGPPGGRRPSGGY